jgi:arginase
VAVIGVPSSAGAHGAGQEQAPNALRAAGLIDQLRSAGLEVYDDGDLAVELYTAREPVEGARNVASVAAVARHVAERVDDALGRGRIPLVLGGDCTITLGVVAGAARHHPQLGLVYFDGDADLTSPAISGSGVLDSMGMAHLLGRGATDLTYLGPRYPLLRPHEVVLFGFDPGEVEPLEWDVVAKERLANYPAPQVRASPVDTAVEALNHLEGQVGAVLLHFDVDVIDDGDFPIADCPHRAGLTLDEAMSCLAVFASTPKLVGIVITEVNPDKDPDGTLLSRFASRVVEAVTGNNADA